MIKTIIKRDGHKETYLPKKINNWGMWAAKTLGDKVDWSSVVINAVSQMPEEVTSVELQEKLIQNCLDKGTWSYYLMAGRLYAAHLHRTIYPNGIPTIKELHEEMIEDGVMRYMAYDTLEYQAINSMLNHEKDFETPHFSLHYIRQKYAIRDKVKNKEYETQQFVYMRMAMALAENERKDKRLDLVEDFYTAFSNKEMSAPTPNYTNLGTLKQGLVSCCLIASGDSEPSLAVGDHIAYRMTAASAGIGANIMCRSIGDPVRSGVIRHQGRLPYYASMGKAVLANRQGSRGGALTSYFSAYDPEADTIMYLRNQRSTENKKNRDMHYAMELNRFFAKKALKNEEAFSFNPYTAPQLDQSFYSGDIKEFENNYKKKENDPNFKKEFFNPRERIIDWMNEGLETGVAYVANIDEMNRHTPFREAIHSSNLCVAPDTMLLTKEHGEVEISTLAGQKVRVWNGKKWSLSLVEKTNENQNLIKVTLSDGKPLECTIYHKWWVLETDDKGKTHSKEARAYELYPGSVIDPYQLPDGVQCAQTVVKIELGRVDTDTYCVHEPEEHKAVFNGILTGQCLEISEVNRPYDSIEDLYSRQTVGFITVKARHNALEYKFDYNKKITLIDDTTSWAGNLKVGDTFYSYGDYSFPITVDEITQVKEEPEVALCSLGGIPYDHIDENDDEAYYRAMYLSLKMIDYCIYNNAYVLPHIKVTAQARMNAGVGLLGVATHMARKHLTYDNKEGLEELHRVAERHMYFAIKASLAIARERGNAPWIHKTKWANGWLPIDTANDAIEELGDFQYRYDWEALRVELKEQGGIAHSCLLAYMPCESSSKAVHSTNSIYPVRDITLKKTDNTITVDWAAPYGDDKAYQYQSAWDIKEVDMIKAYAVMQKFVDQSISADLWRRVSKAEKVPSTDLLNQYFTMVKYGMKTRYYYNSNVSNGVSLTSQIDNGLEKKIEPQSNVNDGPDCEGCSM